MKKVIKILKDELAWVESEIDSKSALSIDRKEKLQEKRSDLKEAIYILNLHIYK